MDKDKLIEELNKNRQYDLADVISDMTPNDVANYIAANKAYFTKVYNSDDLEQMPLFRKALYDDLKTGIVDYDKEFGKDWYKEYGQIPVDQIKYVAQKQGVDWKDLTNKMGQEATKRLRYDIAHDGSLSGYITEFVAPRSLEAVERGESPTGTDIGLDIGQNVLYAAPWARVAAPLAKYGTVGRILQGTAGNAVTPTITEAADAIAYDDPDNPRSEFSKADVATGTAVNLTTPWLIRGALLGAGKLLTGKGRDIANKYMQFGTQRTTKEDIPRLLSDAAHESEQRQVKNTVTKLMPNSSELIDIADAEVYNQAKEELRGKVLYKLQQGKHSKSYFTNEELKLIATDPEIRNLVNTKDLPSNSQLRIEEEIKNYLTNQAGTGWFAQESPWTRVPIVGSRINRMVKEAEIQDSIDNERAQILNDLRARNMLHLYR